MVGGWWVGEWVYLVVVCAVRTKSKKRISGAISIEQKEGIQGAFEGHSGAFGIK